MDGLCAVSAVLGLWGSAVLSQRVQPLTSRLIAASTAVPYSQPSSPCNAASSESCT